MRTKSWKEATVRGVTDGDTLALLIEPGDCTRYRVLLARVSNEVADVADESGGWFVRLTNFSGSTGRAAYVRANTLLLYTDVQRLLGVTAPGSAQLMCELISHVTGATRCESWEAFEARLERDVALAERERAEREAHDAEGGMPWCAQCQCYHYDTAPHVGEKKD